MRRVLHLKLCLVCRMRAACKPYRLTLSPAKGWMRLPIAAFGSFPSGWPCRVSRHCFPLLRSPTVSPPWSVEPLGSVRHRGALLSPLLRRASPIGISGAYSTYWSGCSALPPNRPLHLTGILDAVSNCLVYPVGILVASLGVVGAGNRRAGNPATPAMPLAYMGSKASDAQGIAKVVKVSVRYRVLRRKAKGFARKPCDTSLPGVGFITK